jgi:hypothetical protein
MIEILNMHNVKPIYPYDVKVCRGKSPLGNPFFLKNVNDDAERDTVCNMYNGWFDYKSQHDPVIKNELNRLLLLYKVHGVLRLFCWCSPKRCHAETIKNYIENNLKDE